MSEDGQEKQEIVSSDLNASFGLNSETEGEKEEDSARGTTAWDYNHLKNKRRKDVPSSRPLKIHSIFRNLVQAMDYRCEI